jgi:hypothetical protein
MDRDEARKLLQVERGTAAAELKRAYLRQVKLHPPERDPEQFERVRQAFELLSRNAYYDELVPDFESNPETQASPVVEAASHDASESLLQNSALQNPPEEFSQEYLDEDVSELYEPSSLSDDRLWQLAAQPEQQLFAEAELARRGDETIAGRYLEKLATAAASGESINIHLGLCAVLGLQAAGKRELGCSLMERLNTYVDATGAGVTLLPHTALQLQIAKELSRLPPGAPQFTSIVAKALLQANPAAAEGPLLEFVGKEPKLAKRVKGFLEVHSPALHQLYAQNLKGQRLGSPSRFAVLGFLLPIPAILSAMRGSGVEFGYLGAVLLAVATIGGIAFACYLGLLRLKDWWAPK